MRLIDAGTLVTKIWEQHKKTEESYDLCVDELKDIFCSIVTLIDEQPTVYNVDKVVAELQDKSFERYGNQGMGGELVISLDDAVEIVKRGGADER